MRNDRRFRFACLMGVVCWPVAAGACTVSATPLIFGNIGTLSGEAVDGIGRVSVSCPETTSYEVSIGPAAGGGTGYREMASGENRLEYQVYVDPTRQLPWGDGTASTFTASGSAGSDGLEHVVYGRVFPRRQTFPGHYSDSLVVTITY